jgi:hypothetical protein
MLEQEKILSFYAYMEFIMATANISSTFDITIEGADLNVAKTFTAPRAFDVVGITAINTAASASTLRVTGATAGDVTATTAAPPLAGVGVVQAQSVAGPTNAVTVLAANSSIAKGEVVTVLAGAATVTQVVLHCVASGLGEAITIS